MSLKCIKTDFAKLCANPEALAKAINENHVNFQFDLEYVAHQGTPWETHEKVTMIIKERALGDCKGDMIPDQDL